MPLSRSDTSSSNTAFSITRCLFSPAASSSMLTRFLMPCVHSRAGPWSQAHRPHACMCAHACAWTDAYAHGICVHACADNACMHEHCMHARSMHECMRGSCMNACTLRHARVARHEVGIGGHGATLVLSYPTMHAFHTTGIGSHMEAGVVFQTVAIVVGALTLFMQHMEGPLHAGTSAGAALSVPGAAPVRA